MGQDKIPAELLEEAWTFLLRVTFKFLNKHFFSQVLDKQQCRYLVECKKLFISGHTDLITGKVSDCSVTTFQVTRAGCLHGSL